MNHSTSNSLRPDLRVIAQMVPAGASVLDLGCGKGELLAHLVAHQGVKGRGLELDSANVADAIAHGLSVVQGDMDADLPFYPDGAYDVVVSSQTLQATKDPKRVLAEMARIGKKVVVSVPNFGHWRNRMYLGLKGRMPVTETLSYEWYETPNIHFCTLIDFRVLCEQMGLRVIDFYAIRPDGSARRVHGRGSVSNLLGEKGVFLLERVS
jgi:methionine biosynthesis protein MetW